MEHELDFHLNSPPLSARLKQTVQWAWEILREERHTMLVLISGAGSWDAGQATRVSAPAAWAFPRPQASAIL